MNFLKILRLPVKGRFISDNDTEGNIQGIDSKFRYQTDISYKHDVGIVDLTYRLSYQNSNELGMPIFLINMLGLGLELIIKLKL
jgi:hypothetical protein